MGNRLNSSAFSDGSPSSAERRREPRFPATGVIRLYFADPLPLEVQGRLVDLSRSGFRVAHGFPGFQAGQALHFRHDSGEGMARVMWNRILPEHVETGFFIV